MSTLKDMRDVIIDDLDLYDEDFVESDDIDRLIRIAVKKAESLIHKMADSYFLSYAAIPITAGNNKYDYPSDIYANKIKKIIFDDGGTGSYRVNKAKELDKATANDINGTSSGATLTWLPVNVLGEGKKMQLFPASGDSGTLHVWYIRKAKVLTLDDDVLDIEEFEDYVISIVKTKVYLKDGDDRATDEKALEDELRDAMVSTLDDMVVDDEDEKVILDMSFYDDMVGE